MERVMVGIVSILDVKRLAILFSIGLFIVGTLYIIGFAPYPALHDAFHDVRHALGFPCH